jgi:hypothetical protein
MRKPGALAVLCSLSCLSGVAAADTLASPATPDADLFAAIWPRGYEYDEKLGITGSFGLGFGRVDGASGVAGEASGAIGKQGDDWLVVATSELSGFGASADALELRRGRHAALGILRGGEDLGVIASLGGTIEHGDGAALAPLRLGVGRRVTGDAHAEAQLLFFGDDDESPAFVVRGDAGGTRWEDTSGDERRLALEMGFGLSPNDDELPRGMMDFIHARVEHATVRPPVALQAISGAGALGDREVRRVDVGLGAHELTLNIDHELVAVITSRLGWAWQQADTPSGQLSTNMFAMQLGIGARWRERRRPRVTHVGLGIARQPDYLADGSRLVKDWRLELAGGVETPRLALAAKGGLSWLIPSTSGAASDTVIRYGSELSAFVKVGAGVEVGAYHAMAFEPATGDPWAVDGGRVWSSEYGLMARIRTDEATRAARRPLPVPHDDVSPGYQEPAYAQPPPRPIY